MIQCRKIPADNLPDPLYCTRIESMTHALGTYCVTVTDSVKANFRRSFQSIHSTLSSIVAQCGRPHYFSLRWQHVALRNLWHWWHTHHWIHLAGVMAS